MTWLRLPPPADAGPWLSHMTLAERRYEYSFVAAADDEAITALQALLEKLLTARARNPVNPRPQGALWPAVNGYPFTIEGRVPGIAAAGETSFGGLWVDIGLADPAETEVHRGKSWIASCFIDPRLDVYQSSWGGEEGLGERYPKVPEILPGPLLLVALHDRMREHLAVLPDFDGAMACLAWAWVLRQRNRGFYGESFR